MMFMFLSNTVKLNQAVRGRADAIQALSSDQFPLSTNAAKCPLLSKLNRVFLAVETRFPVEFVVFEGTGINDKHDIKSTDAKRASITRATPFLLFMMFIYLACLPNLYRVYRVYLLS